MKLGLISNDRLEPWVNWSTLAPPLFANMRELGDVKVISPPYLQASGLRDWLNVRAEIKDRDTLFWIQPSARAEPSVHAASFLNLRARRAVFIYDAFEPALDKIGLLASLQRFDPCFVAFREAKVELERRFPRGRFEWLPFGIDVNAFSPSPEPKSIFAFWMGRRLEPLHNALIAYCAERSLVYSYRKGNEFPSPLELGRMAASSQYFVVTPPDLDNPARTGRFSPLVMRYMEGLSAGARLLGVLPKSGEYEALLPLDAICQVAPDGSDLREKLDADLRNEGARAAVERATELVRKEHSWGRRAEQVYDRLMFGPRQETKGVTGE